MNLDPATARKGRAALTPTEKQFQAQVVQLAKLRGWKVYHTYDSRRCDPGFPDLLMARRPRVVVAELKVGRNRLTAEQLAWLSAFVGTAVENYEWRPDDWPEIERTLA